MECAPAHVIALVQARREIRLWAATFFTEHGQDCQRNTPDRGHTRPQLPPIDDCAGDLKTDALPVIH